MSGLILKTPGSTGLVLEITEKRRRIIEELGLSKRLIDKSGELKGLSSPVWRNILNSESLTSEFAFEFSDFYSAESLLKNVKFTDDELTYIINDRYKRLETVDSNIENIAKVKGAMEEEIVKRLILEKESLKSCVDKFIQIIIWFQDVSDDFIINSLDKVSVDKILLSFQFEKVLSARVCSCFIDNIIGSKSSYYCVSRLLHMSDGLSDENITRLYNYVCSNSESFDEKRDVEVFAGDWKVQFWWDFCRFSRNESDLEYVINHYDSLKEYSNEFELLFCRKISRDILIRSIEVFDISDKGWSIISERQELSVEDIRRFKGNLDIPVILEYQDSIKQSKELYNELAGDYKIIGSVAALFTANAVNENIEKKKLDKLLKFMDEEGITYILGK